MDNRISFVIPAYNAASTLEEAVRSVFAGNRSEGDEVIIVDDCSTDGTAELAARLQKEFAPDVTVIRNAENKGCPASRNVGIGRARNALIFNLDSDNVLPPGGIALLKEALLREDADVAAFGEYRYFKASPRHITHRWVCKPGVFTLADLLCGILNPGPGGNYLYRKAIWDKVGGYWEYGKGLHEAWGFSMKLLAAGARFIVVPDAYYYHRYSHQSLFMRENKKAGESALVSNKFILPIIPLLDTGSQTYVSETPDWFDRLDRHPLRLADGSVGKDGMICYDSPVRWAARFLKRILRAS